MLLNLINRLRNKQKPSSTTLAEILGQLSSKESLLGMKEITIPEPKDIRDDAAAIYRYSNSSDYKKYVDEVWARIISSLDKILDDRSSEAVRQHHCGQVKAMLDLLRLSYTAKSIMEQYDQEHTAPLQQAVRKA